MSTPAVTSHNSLSLLNFSLTLDTVTFQLQIHYPQNVAPLTEKQKGVAEKLANTVNTIQRNVQNTINQQRTAGANFVSQHVTPLQQPLAEMTPRTSAFFSKIMQKTDEVLMQNKYQAMWFQCMAFLAQDPNIRKKLVEGVALEPVKSLITELDHDYPATENHLSAVDAIINEGAQSTEQKDEVKAQ